MLPPPSLSPLQAGGLLFAYAEVVYSATLLVGYWGYFLIYPPSIEPTPSLQPDKGGTDVNSTRGNAGGAEASDGGSSQPESPASADKQGNNKDVMISSAGGGANGGVSSEGLRQRRQGREGEEISRVADRDARLLGRPEEGGTGEGAGERDDRRQRIPLFPST